MKKNTLTKIYPNKSNWRDSESSLYKAYGNDGSTFACDIEDMKISGIRAYSPITGTLTLATKAYGNNVWMEMAVSSEDMEEILSGEYRNIIIRTSYECNGVIAGSLLSSVIKKDPCYLISASGIPDLLRNSGESITGMRKAAALLEYLSLFDKDAGIIAAGMDIHIIAQTLSCPCISMVAVVPEGTEVKDLPEDTAVLDIKYISVTVHEDSNDLFKKEFLRIIDDYGIKPDESIYAYLLNDIDRTVTLETIRAIAENHVNKWTLGSFDNEYGTSILYNAVNCHDGCFTSVAAQCGAAYADSVNDCLDIIRYLIHKGFKYNPHSSDKYDIAEMANALYDSYKIGRVFRTMIEQGYNISNDDEFMFMMNFISMAESNDHLTPIDDSHNPSYYKRLDKIRCEQFAEISPYINDVVFEIRDSGGDSLLIHAAKRLENLPKLFKMILSRSSNVDAKDEDGYTALHYVTDLERWNALIEAGADTETKDNDGEKPGLSLKKEAIEELLSLDEYSESDRILAAKMLFCLIDDCYAAEETYRNFDYVMKLLDIIKPDVRDEWTKYTPLMAIIVQEGFFPEIYDKMLSIGIDINAETGGENVLRLAVLSPECTAAKIRYLIGHGADGSALVPWRGTVANIAAALFHLESLEWNALWEYPDKTIFTYTHKAETKGDADVDSPLMIALEYQNMEAVRFLISHDAIVPSELACIEDVIQRMKSRTVKAEAGSLLAGYKARIKKEKK